MAPITELDYLKKRDATEPLSDAQKANMAALLKAVNTLLNARGGMYYGVSSGYRPPSINAAANGAKSSCHLTCEAVDLRDPDGRLADWCLQHLKVLEECGLYMESPKHTVGWVHLQTRPTRNRVFIP